MSAAKLFRLKSTSHRGIIALTWIILIVMESRADEISRTTDFEPVPVIKHGINLSVSLDMLPAHSEGISTVSATAGDEGVLGAGQSETVSNVLRMAFQSHPLVLEAESLIQAEQFGIEGARAGFYPYLQVTSALADRSQDGNVTVSAVQPLFDGGLVRSQLRQAKSQFKASELNLQQVRLALSDEVLRATFDILQADDQLRLFERYIDDLQQSKQTIERRAEKGVAPDADVQTVLARISQAQAGRETVRASRSSARSRLSSLVSGPPPEVRWPDDALRMKTDELEILMQDVERNPAVRLAAQAIVTQRAQAGAAKASIWPQLSLQHRRQLSGRQFDPSNDATLLVLQYQTTNGYKAYQGYTSELARLESAERKLDSTRANLKAVFRADIVQYLTAVTQYASQQNASRSLTELASSYRRQFDVGRKTWIELLNAQREAHEARMLLITFKRSFWQSDLRILLQSMNWQNLGLEEFSDHEAQKSEPKLAMPSPVPAPVTIPSSLSDSVPGPLP